MSNTDAAPRNDLEAIEVVRADFPRGGQRAAIFDFDGTLSLLRRNWQDVMIPMMVDELAATPAAESRPQLQAAVEEFVMRLNGRQIIYQMIQLADVVRSRGGQPCDPLVYKRQYHRLLWGQVSERVEAVASGRVDAAEMCVPGAHRLLDQLQDRGLTLYLASGTDLPYVRNEVAVLGMEAYFGDHVYGAVDDYKRFSKAMILQQMMAGTGLAGRHIVGFGDGFVEIEEVKKVGGLAIGVASDENTRCGINAWKRQRLIQAGADIIIGDYRQQDALLDLIGIA